MRRSPGTGIGWAATAASLVVGAGNAGAATAEYRGGATVVVKREGSDPTVDRGIVVCRSSGPSVGGACLPFDGNNSVRVDDDRAGLEVAFQVCIDNDGDGVCGGDPRRACADDLFFSHDDAGRFFNPLGPLPTSFRPGCPGGFPGYVVFLCQGIHQPPDPGAGTHVHTVSKGTASSVFGGTGFGNFCQPAGGEPGKSYVLR